MTKTATVLGAGIQGVCVSLMLQKHGYTVKLIDKCSDIITRASLSHEGKIHLGFVYGLDQTMQTGYKLTEDALHFGPYIEYLLDIKPNWEALRSKINIYLVPHDSMLSSDGVEEYFEKLNNKFQEIAKQNNLHYLGRRPDRIFSRIEIPSYVNSSEILAAFETEEISINQVELKQLLKDKVFSLPEIHLLTDHEIVNIKRNREGFSTECKNIGGESKNIESDILVNCLWESRIRFDKMMGLFEESSYSLRLKYGIIVKKDSFLQNISSLDLVHGAFGSIVVSDFSDEVYLCWYPVSMLGIIDYAPLPQEWEQACNGYVSDELHDTLVQKNYAGFKKYLPQLKDFEVIRIKAGVILAEGNKIDIGHRDSKYHFRANFPIREANGYYSVNTSKYTSAPRNTMILEKMIFGKEF